MKSLRLILVLSLLATTTDAQQIKWYPFDKDFVSNQYSNSAIGELRVKKFKAAKTIHSESCGGNDAELHIGIKKSDIDLPNSQGVYNFVTGVIYLPASLIAGALWVVNPSAVFILAAFISLAAIATFVWLRPAQQ